MGAQVIELSSLADSLLGQQRMANSIAKQHHAIDWLGVRDRVSDTRDHSRHTEVKVILGLNDVQKQVGICGKVLGAGVDEQPDYARRQTSLADSPPLTAVHRDEDTPARLHDLP
jgi:hypothetical protein